MTVIKDDRVRQSERTLVIPLSPAGSVEDEKEYESRRRSSRKEIARQARGLYERAKAEREKVVESARAEAEAVRSAAESNAERLVREATEQKEAIEKAARELGYKEGHEEGIREAREKTAEILMRLEAVVAEARAARREIIDSSRNGILDVVTAVARRVVKREIIAGETAKAQIEAALRHISSAERVTVRVNIEDLPAAGEMRGYISERIKGLSMLEIIEDPGVEKGGAVVETAFGRMDARLDSQLDEIERELRSVPMEEPE